MPPTLHRLLKKQDIIILAYDNIFVKQKRKTEFAALKIALRVIA
ncbi:MAG: hypothetical protein BSOLF_0070 [Candidatus Carbobacillus altaicus]|uniref:Uncharacterized protein n=1 Tax=Candidatus Carbonibacillus altaicus TaxID=2163959 RepID=A0A2R6XXL0_9BACL|nr:MAG: hypothetical protein BSOLF_0070 [Candidatus Carbobacillus altaicus]